MREVQNIFEPKAARVIRVMLFDPKRAWTYRALAQETGISLGYTHAVIASLSRMKYVDAAKSGKITIMEPLTLLKRWAAYHQFDRMNTFLGYHSYEKETGKLFSKLSHIKEDYAVTGLAGASLAAPHVIPTTVDIYVRTRKNADIIASKLNLSPIESGGNVKLVLPYDDGVFYSVQQLKKVRTVSNIQLYVDLFNFPARGMEAAEHLLRVIKKSFSESLLGG